MAYTPFFGVFIDKLFFLFAKAYRSHFWEQNKAAPTVRIRILFSFALVLLVISKKSLETGLFYTFFGKVLIFEGQLQKMKEIDLLFITEKVRARFG